METKKTRASYSRLKKLKIAPAMVLVETESSPAMELGTALHSYILQPEKFKEEYHVVDDTKIIAEIGGKNPRATTKYKEWANTLPNDKKLLKLAEIDYFEYAKKQLEKNRFFNYIMKGAILEEKIIFNYKINDNISLECSAIPDIVNVEKKVIIDLKTCQNASKNQFQKDCAKFDYHIQSAMYIQSCKEKYGDGDWTFMFLAVETKEPYLFQFFECDEQFVSVGKHDTEMLLLLWNDCLENGFNRGYEVFCENPMKVEKLSLPAWKTFENINFF